MQVTENKYAFVEKSSMGAGFISFANRDTSCQIVDTQGSEREESEESGSPGVGMTGTFHLLDWTTENISHCL